MGMGSVPSGSSNTVSSGETLAPGQNTQTTSVNFLQRLGLEGMGDLGANQWGPSSTVNTGLTTLPPRAPASGGSYEDRVKAFAPNINTMGSAELQSRWSTFVGEMAAQGGAIDPNELVQAVLREAYVANTEDLRFYAQKVQYFNTCKKLVRKYLQELRDNNQARKDAEAANGFNPIPSKEPDDKGNLKPNPSGKTYQDYINFNMKWFSRPSVGSSSPQQQLAKAAQDQMASMDATIAKVGFSQGVEKTWENVVSTLETQFGPLPDDVKNLLHARLQDAFKEPHDKKNLDQVMRLVAGYISYLSDCGTGKDGKFGTGGPDVCNDAGHVTSGPSLKDFQYYLGGLAPSFGINDSPYVNDHANDSAHANLAAGDIRLLEQAFGWPPGILNKGGGSTIEDVVAAACSVAGNAWWNQITTNTRASTAQLYNDVATGGLMSEKAEQIFGKEFCAAIRAFAASIGGPGETLEDQARRDLQIPNEVPPASVRASVAKGSDPDEAMDAEIKKWEEKLNGIGDDAQLANVDLQNMLQKQQQTLQMMSNISKMLHDTAMAVIRKIGG